MNQENGNGFIIFSDPNFDIDFKVHVKRFSSVNYTVYAEDELHVYDQPDEVQYFNDEESAKTAAKKMLNDAKAAE